MSFVVFPIFINSSMFEDKFTRYLFTFGMAVAFMIALPLMVEYQHSVWGSQCGIDDKNYGQAMKTWRDSCLKFEWQAYVGLPMVFEILGSIFLIMGIIMVIQDRTTKPSKPDPLGLQRTTKLLNDLKEEQSDVLYCGTCRYRTEYIDEFENHLRLTRHERQYQTGVE